MIAQRLVFIGGYPDGIWSCAWCAAELNEAEIIHRDNCRWIAEIAAAERERIARFLEQPHALRSGSWHAARVRKLTS